MCVYSYLRTRHLLCYPYSYYECTHRVLYGDANCNDGDNKTTREDLPCLHVEGGTVTVERLVLREVLLGDAVAPTSWNHWVLQEKIATLPARKQENTRAVCTGYRILENHLPCVRDTHRDSQL